MQQYLNQLFNQYKDAFGITNDKIKYQDCKEDFCDWLSERKKLSETYLSILENEGLNFEETRVGEMGKGPFDSVLIDNREGTLITPYSKLFNDSKNNIVTGDFMIFMGLPVSVQTFRTNTYSSMSTLNPINYIDTAMTFNPYRIENISNWNLLNNSARMEIIVSMFGLSNDKDKKTKIEQLNKFKEKLKDNTYLTDNLEIDGGYYSIVRSKRKVMK